MNIRQRRQRILLLEKRTAPKSKIYVLIYDKKTGRVQQSSHNELIGLTEAEVDAVINSDDISLNVKYAEPPTVVYIPDNGRG